jgi:hypothetical protein
LILFDFFHINKLNLRKWRRRVCLIECKIFWRYIYSYVIQNLYYNHQAHQALIFNLRNCCQELIMWFYVSHWIQRAGTLLITVLFHFCVRDRGPSCLW